MAVSDAAAAAPRRLERLQPRDAEGLCALSIEAGWNQVAADWRLMLDLGWGYGVRGPKGPRIAKRAGAAARTDHLLDQHGAGDPAGAGPWPRHAPADALHRRGRGERRRRGPRCHRAGVGRSTCRSVFATSIRSRAGTRNKVCAMRWHRRAASWSAPRRRATCKRICAYDRSRSGFARSLHCGRIC